MGRPPLGARWFGQPARQQRLSQRRMSDVFAKITLRHLVLEEMEEICNESKEARTSQTTLAFNLL